MTKSEIKDFLLNHKRYICENIFKKKFSQTYLLISEITYPNTIITFSQKLYHYLNDDIEKWSLGKCKICGCQCKYRNLNIGYLTYCSCKCAGKDDVVKEKNKQTNIDRYGENYCSIRSIKSAQTFNNKSDDVKLDKIKKQKQTNLLIHGDKNYNNKLKQQETMINKYGGIGFESKPVMDKYLETMLEKYGDISYRNHEKYIQSNISKYGVEHYSKTDEFKSRIENTQLMKYGGYYVQTDECKMKVYNTKKKNHTFNSSKIEVDLSNWLTDNRINFRTQYKSDVYPFSCDFYLTDYDLYIEIQGHWTHGGHPYNEDDENDNIIVESWKLKDSKFYQEAIKTWTMRDVTKRNIASQNKLNYLEIFSDDLNICIETINNYINEM
jgi:very-short-patch-repair endonuclease